MPRLPAAPRYSRRSSGPRYCREKSPATVAHPPARTDAAQVSDAQPPSSVVSGRPTSCVMIGVLKGDTRSLESFLLRLRAIRPHRKRANSIKESHFVRRIELNCRSDDIWIVKGANRDLRGTTRLKRERRAAFSAKAAPHPVRTCETTWIPARPFEIMDCHQRAEDSTKCLLAHAAVTDRRAAKAGGAKAYGATLTAAGMKYGAHRAISQVVPSLESLSTTPMAASSSRIRSASLKFFLLRAVSRASIKLTTLVSSTAADSGRNAVH